MKNLKVAFDLTTVAFEKKTGTGVYCQELAQAYQNSFPEDSIVHAYRFTRALKGSRYRLPLKSENVTSRILADPWTYWRGGDLDVFHGLNARLPLLNKAKLIVTIHDLFSIFGQFSEPEFLNDQKEKIMKTLKRSDHIITPAQHTRTILIDKMNISEHRISVVGEGVRSIYLEKYNRQEEIIKASQILQSNSQYFLFVGTLEKRKNLTGALEAFARFISGRKQKFLFVLVGGEGFGFQEIKNKIESLNLKDHVKMLGYLDDITLITLFRGAEALIYLSLEEGFGIPIIESMAVGLPVISSDTTSLPEVGAGLTHMVAPNDVIGASILFSRAIDKSPEWMAITEHARAHARQLTWSWVAQKTREVYLKVLNTKS